MRTQSPIEAAVHNAVNEASQARRCMSALYKICSALGANQGVLDSLGSWGDKSPAAIAAKLELEADKLSGELS